MKIPVNKYLLSVTAGAVASLPFLFELGLVSVICLLPAIYLLSFSDKLSLKQLLLQCYIFGLTYFGLVIFWMFNINAADLLGETWIAPAFKVITYILVCSVFSLSFLIFGWLYRSLSLNMNSKKVLIVPLVWVCSQFLGSIVFSILSYGPGGSIGAHWNFGNTGLVLASTPLSYASRFVGLYGLGLIALYLAISLFRLLQKRWLYLVIPLSAIALALLGKTIYMPSSRSIDAVVTNFPAEDRPRNLEQINDSLSTLPKTDLLVFPEYSHTFYDSQGKRTKFSLRSSVDLVVDSRSVTAEGGFYNMGTYYNRSGDIYAQQQKSFLIPAGEYIPYFYEFILVISGNGHVVNNFQDNRGMLKAKESESPVEKNNVKYGLLVCSGGISPAQYRRLTHRGAQVLVNSASTSTLGVSPLYHRQAKQMASFIAVSNATPFLQATRGGPSYILNNSGNMVENIKESESVAFASSKVNPPKHRTIYSIFGEIILTGAFFVLITRAFFVRPKFSSKIFCALRRLTRL